MTTVTPEVAALYDAMARSAHIAYIAACRERFAAPFFPLSSDEIEQLQRAGNSAEDWARVRKTRADVCVSATRVRDCQFQGFVVLGQFDESHTVDGIALPSGCYRSALRNAIILDNALVQNTTALCNVVVDEHASVLSCGSVVGDEETNAANGMTLHVGVEIGGRNLDVFAELSFDVAKLVAGQRSETKLLEDYATFVQRYTQAARTPFSVIGRHARAWHCSRLAQVFIGEFAVVEDAELRDVTLLSSEDEPSVVRSKSIVHHAIVQWNVTVESLSVVERAFLCDASHVERHGVVMHSFVGPNTSIAEGEVTSSFVGPFVGFHHQALLIASFWPEGKGNVGYGANVGSNHTLKAPDQELFPGEGVFFGLGCCVKFPSNFTKAPYSVIATGVATLPQSVEMPFALINTPGHNIPALSPAINEISPGWVLAHSVFTVLRNEAKFATRNRSRRTEVEAALFRPDVVQCMKDARQQLKDAERKSQLQLANGEAIFTDKQVRGLGKNYMRETARREAVEAYTSFIQLTVRAPYHVSLMLCSLEALLQVFTMRFFLLLRHLQGFDFSLEFFDFALPTYHVILF
ncbi:hypothetical protein ATCC90586_004015 [Pythium insidiosum]|nr:hypothetical protein ATCC90586_004015 [Pythium insidiosum]